MNTLRPAQARLRDAVNSSRSPGGHGRLSCGLRALQPEIHLIRAMASKVLLRQQKSFTVVVLLACLACEVICETGDCGQQEFRDQSGSCVLCKQCGPGMELSKRDGTINTPFCILSSRIIYPVSREWGEEECGFGYGEDAQCVKCRPHRFKEDWGSQKCKPCLDCALLSRFQKANCSATGDAVCGDCLPGFYRKTKLVGFQDMECVPCGDPPPPYEPHCTSKVNLVRIPSTASSPRDTALAAVICSALATVLLALLVLCVIYCKRQFVEKKPSWSLRAQDLRCNGSELSCFDRPRPGAPAPRACCQCLRDSAQARGPVHLVPSRCCGGACGISRDTPGCRGHCKAALQDRGTKGLASFFSEVSSRACVWTRCRLDFSWLLGKKAIHLLLRKCTDMGTENLHFIPGLLAPSMEDSCGLMKLDTEARFQ
ncbi:hypothetical protein MJG53_009903 [Ovis ammon polii x Ovis aries]|uniref:Uncharacterized protein n=1 Tax=Ovis ammon polii x Ovis aries TaxID=2918886 RepID=A0ACB9UW86_9CETA|nr:hypothetical protein MJG53_009903 [Ovis ammon polii x Ovis aries]